MKINKNQTHRGFTLVELLVVIVIIATLVGISMSAVMRFRKSADKTVALGNLRQIQTANIAYASDHQGRFVPPEGEVTVDTGGAPTTDTYKWFENPELLSELKGEKATYGSGATPDTSVPLSLMDPAIVRDKPANYEKLSGSYAYTKLSTDEAVITSQLEDASRSAAFITADGDGFIDHSTKGNIAYRHDDKAVVVYYGGNAATVKVSDIDKFDGSDLFWEPVE